MNDRRIAPLARAAAFVLVAGAAVPAALAEVPYDGWRGQRASYAGGVDRRPLDNSPRNGVAYNPPSPVYARERWAGFYVGAHLGGGWGNARPKGLSTDPVSIDGFLGGVHGGYNLQFGQVVVGAELDASWSGNDGMRFYAGPGAAVGANMDWMGSMRGRLGYAWDSFIVYGTAGLAVSSLGVDTAGPGGFSSTRERMSGLVYGAGVEMKLTPQVSARFEALRYNFQDQTHDTSAGALNIGADVTTVRAGINWHFN